MKYIWIFLIIFFVAGCSNRGVYDAVKAGDRNDCAKLPPSQYDDCMKDANISYEEYSRDRNEILNKK